MRAGEPGARAGSSVRAEGDRSKAQDRARLQDLVRQGQPDQRLGRARDGAGAGAADFRRDQIFAWAAGPDRCARGRAVRSRGAGGRCAADSGVPVPADRLAAGGGCHRQGRQRQERPVPGALGYGQCRHQADQRRQQQRDGHRARRLVWLQHAGLGYACAADPGAHHRRTGDLRRHPFGAAAGRQGRVIRR